VACGLGEIGGVGEHLRGDAPHVQAGATEPLLAVDEGHLPVVEPCVDDRIATTGADDAQVEMPHAPIVPRARFATAILLPTADDEQSRGGAHRWMPEYECRPE